MLILHYESWHKDIFGLTDGVVSSIYCRYSRFYGDCIVCSRRFGLFKIFYCGNNQYSYCSNPIQVLCVEMVSPKTFDGRIDNKHSRHGFGVVTMSVVVRRDISHIPVLVDEYIVANFERIGLILFNSFINRGISTAIGEELLFRGFLFSYLLSITKPINAFVISIMVFVLPHMLVFQPDLTALFILINYISVSLLLTALYYKTKSISTSIVFHALYNFILYGIWNVGSTGESDSSIFTSIMSNTESDGIILFSAVCLILMSCFIFKSNKNWQVCAAIELTD